MTIRLDGSSLTIENLVAISRGEKIELAAEALERIRACRAMLEEKLAAKEIMYGTNTGIGEFSIHKEFVSSKVAGDTASLSDPALDRILAFAGEAGLVVILHNDIDMPFAHEGVEPVYLDQMKTLLRRHPGTTIIWAHVGLGRVVQPIQSSASAAATERAEGQMALIVGAILEDPTLAHVYFDISWDEVAKYIVATDESTRAAAAVINRYPDRFLFGTDAVAPADAARNFKPRLACRRPRSASRDQARGGGGGGRTCQPISAGGLAARSAASTGAATVGRTVTMPASLQHLLPSPMHFLVWSCSWQSGQLPLLMFCRALSWQ